MSQGDEQATGGALARAAGRAPLWVWGERVSVVLIVAGLLGLIQPWVQDLYTNGFTVLLLGTIIFIVASHL
jgi:hypothetical protein